MNDEYVAPSSPAAYLMWHILKKGFQAGGVVGVAAVIPALFILKKVREPVSLLHAMGYSTLTVTAASATLGAVKFTKIDQAGFEDRAYRLHYNVNQNRTDDFSAVGALVGLAAAAVLVPRGGGGSAGMYGMALLGGSAVGCAAGVAMHVATAPKEMKHPNKALHELKRND
ncbi:hypothetical protein VOLCADRAFT_93294 [Volvox carteri f. nagariensis]|uniref:Uncharacterized protein n=1 Tax=Volvox carteri f. nagariensis TaxID=3068 RepID=D8U1R6_VOLCA|nr:uncharacterized protein VOLCADRAFT_93294 [Volvox carteri f. nagariensis]EFJ46457.1 hypothetical protein VOLCADRAFT_93294 [Volvox carteri f. nagariensis]|eukprot:XP_002952610.1 hypothetical protein VOLCADRAFT_93294 [Volvox carteri f. nagariensis]